MPGNQGARMEDIESTCAHPPGNRRTPRSPRTGGAGSRPSNRWEEALPAAGITLALALGSPIALDKTAEPRYIDVTDNTGIQDAAARGDVARLQEIASQSPKSLVRHLSTAMAARAIGDLRTSDAELKICVEESGKAPDLDHVTFTTFCGQALAGNEFMRGDYAAWGQFLQAVVVATTPYFQPRAPGHPLIFNAIAGIDINGAAKLPPVSGRVQVPPGAHLARLGAKSGAAGTLQFIYDEFGNSTPFEISISINGTPVTATFDIGADISSVERKTADRLHLPVLLPQFLTLKHDQSDVGVNTDLRGVESIKSGSIDFGPAQIASGTPHAVLGLDLIRSLGSIRISESGISQAKPPSGCNDDLSIASSWIGNSTLMAHMMVDGKPSVVRLDTGSNAPLTVFEEKQVLNPGVQYKEVRFIHVGGEQPWLVRAGSATLDGQPIALRRDVAAPSKAYDYVLGVGALKTLDLYLDLPRMKMCIVEAKR